MTIRRSARDAIAAKIAATAPKQIVTAKPALIEGKKDDFLGMVAVFSTLEIWPCVVSNQGAAGSR